MTERFHHQLGCHNTAQEVQDYTCQQRIAEGKHRSGAENHQDNRNDNHGNVAVKDRDDAGQNVTVKVVPFPGSLSSVIFPL